MSRTAENHLSIKQWNFWIFVTAGLDSTYHTWGWVDQIRNIFLYFMSNPLLTGTSSTIFQTNVLYGFEVDRRLWVDHKTGYWSIMAKNIVLPPFPLKPILYSRNVVVKKGTKFFKNEWKFGINPFVWLSWVYCGTNFRFLSRGSEIPILRNEFWELKRGWGVDSLI